MQEYEIRITEHALSSMREISHHIAMNLMSPQAALHTLSSIRNNINSLNSFPERIPLTDEEPWRSKGIHKMLSGNFLSIFGLTKKTKGYR